MIYLGLGEKEQAKQYLDLATNSDQPFPGKTVAETALKQLG
jgi:hypothetical protein